MRITAKTRELLGKKAKRIRKELNIPAVVFGSDIESIPLSVDYRDFVKVYTQAGATSLVDLAVEGYEDPFKVLISDVQLNPVDYRILHARFFKVNLKEKTEVDIPVVITGEELIPLVKSGEALILTQLSEITVSALPMDLPKEFVVDVSKLSNIGDSIKISDLDYDHKKVEIIDQSPDAIVAILDAVQAEEAPEAEVTEAEVVAGIEVTEEKPEEETNDSGKSEKDEKSE